MVEDKDVQDRRGYGVIVNSAYTHSVQVWGREEAVRPESNPVGCWSKTCLPRSILSSPLKKPCSNQPWQLKISQKMSARP